MSFDLTQSDKLRNFQQENQNLENLLQPSSHDHFWDTSTRIPAYELPSVVSPWFVLKAPHIGLHIEQGFEIRCLLSVAALGYHTLALECTFL